MNIVTWNVNSVRQRLPRTLALLQRHDVSVLGMQETKTVDGMFPTEELSSAGYRCAIFGQTGRNGVALVSRHQPKDLQQSFPGDPVPEQARVVAATIDEVRYICIYAINGKFAGAPEYDVKLQWYDALIEWISREHSASDAVVLMGDFNVAPEDRDVHDPAAWREENLASSAERSRVRALLDWGFTDVLRLHHEGPGPFTWWDYRAGAFHKGWGLRIDLVLATEPIAKRCTAVIVDRDERKPTSGEGKPSDHAPVVASFS